VRYVSASAPSSRWDVSAEYAILVPDDGDDEEEGEDDDDEGKDE
jgi:hypothetical protein